MAKITCVGILVADLIGRPIDRFPEKGKLMLVPEMELHVGGCAHNTGVVLRKLGEEVRVIGKVGRDDLGEVVIRSLERHGVDARGVVLDDVYHTSATMVILDTAGERTFLHYPGTNSRLRAQDVPDEFLRDVQVIHVAGSFLMPGFDGEETALLFRRAKSFGVTTSLDTAWDDTGKWLATIEPVLPYVDIFISNRDESSRISGKTNLVEIARFFLDFGITIVAIKMGEEGSFIMTEKEKIVVPPFQVQAVDGTGAGDAFAAGFLTGYLKGWDLYEVGRFANACGAMCVQKMGATEGVGTLEEVLAFMRRHEVGG
ncbi:MAG: carbohydrate kinase family protein [Candidatus Atribacteria bacterium]|nr:carbohydrate kinase family protein [Candidatus Atribacteria bacterium]